MCIKKKKKQKKTFSVFFAMFSKINNSCNWSVKIPNVTFIKKNSFQILVSLKNTVQLQDKNSNATPSIEIFCM